MKNLIRLFLILLIAGSAIGINTSCAEENDCSLSGRPMVYCNLYTINPDNKEVRKDTLDSLTITAFGTDSIILNNQKKVHSLMLPLRYTVDSTVLVFHYEYSTNPLIADTVVIEQSNTPYFESMECGYSMKQKITNVKFRNGRTLDVPKIDSIDVRNKDANTNGTENFKIFYRF